MVNFSELLETDFDGRPTADLDDVIYGGLDDPRHRSRVPGLAAILHNSRAPERERFLSCVALTTWAEPVGYQTVVEATVDPKEVSWYECLIDRKFSVDSTFSKLAVAVADSDEMASEKGTADQRLEAFQQLIRIADSEYFEDRLGELFDETTTRAALVNIADTVKRGQSHIRQGAALRFDLGSQLIDLACAVAPVDESLAIQLGMDILSTASWPRVQAHAVSIVHRARGPEGRQFAEYLMSVGDKDVREQVLRALDRF